MKDKLLRKVPIEDLTPEAFARYGRVVEVPKSSPNKCGLGWDCWTPVDLIQATTPIGVGIVHTCERPLVVTEMERHVRREELLWPTDTAVIQPMALPERLDDPAAQPDPSTVRVFLIRPGQAIIMAKGAWHSAAYPAGSSAVYFFAIETMGDGIGDDRNPWVPFPGSGYVGIVRP